MPISLFANKTDDDDDDDDDNDDDDDDDDVTTIIDYDQRNKCIERVACQNRTLIGIENTRIKPSVQ